MALIVKRFVESYIYAINELADPRTNKWFLVESPVSIFFIVAIYLAFVKDVGPNFMKNRKPVNLKYVLIIYNAVQILLNIYIAIKLLQLTWNYDLRCSPINYSYDANGMEAARLVWLYFLVKLIDLLDTIFFVFRKNERQITFLHVYHHAIMLVTAWVGIKYIAGGHTMYLGIINSAVHAVMYFYYLLTCFNSKYKKSVWWKKYITQMQLVQFTLIFSIYMQPIIASNCGYPLLPIIFLLPQNLFMMLLFGDFYYKTYIKKQLQQQLK